MKASFKSILLSVAAWLILFPAAFERAACAADVDWSGSWNTKWRDGGARLDLQQSGDHVAGRYPLYGGEVDAEATGRELKGRWIAGPRSGTFLFSMGPEGRTFAGRYDNGEWWTGGRTRGDVRTLPVDQSGVRETVRTFVQAGNLAKAGFTEELGTAAAVVDVGNRPQPVLQNEKLRFVRDLFDVISLATFHIWSLPGKQSQEQSYTAKLHQAGTDVVLPLNLARGADGKWFIVAPTEDELGTARKALLVRYGGRQPAPSAFLKLHTARDTMTAFQTAFADWDYGGRERVLDTLDASQLFPATRTYEATLAAQYLKLVLDRVSKTAPQEIPDDPADRQPYEVFSHPSGSIVIAPTGEGDRAVWRFTPETLQTIRTLYAAVEAMPLAGAKWSRRPLRRSLRSDIGCVAGRPA